MELEADIWWFCCTHEYNKTTKYQLPTPTLSAPTSGRPRVHTRVHTRVCTHARVYRRVLQVKSGILYRSQYYFSDRDLPRTGFAGEIWSHTINTSNNLRTCTHSFLAIPHGKPRSFCTHACVHTRVCTRVCTRGLPAGRST